MTDDGIKEHLIEWHKLVDAAQTKPEVSSYVKQLISKDPIYFFNTFLFTYDPRTNHKILPFVLFPFQRDLVHLLSECYRNKENLLVEKSRDMGFSWVVLGFVLWLMITQSNFSAGVGSRKMLLVDELGNMKSLMQRLRFMINYLPKFLKGSYTEKNNSKMGFITLPDQNSTCTGEAGDDIGRGDRTSLYLIDEFAHIPRSATVQEAISQTSDFIIYGSTPKGKGNEFARLRWQTSIKRFSMHWKQHPEKDEEWYNKQKELLTEAQIAQELDISYDKSIEGRVHKWFDIQKHANEVIQFNPNYPLLATFDWGIGDPTACLIMQYYGGIIHIINYFQVKDSTIEKIFHILASKLGKYNCTMQNLAAIYGDPDGRNRNIITGTSIKDYIYNKYKYTLRFKLPNVITNRILAVRKMGEDGRIKVCKNLTEFQDCLLNYRYPDKEHGENEKPLHDWTSHACSALEYYCDYEHGYTKEQKPKPIVIAAYR